MEMKHNHSYGENGRDFNEYIHYLNTIKSSIPLELYDFISDPNRHDFSDKSLHDSRIEEIQFANEFESKGPNMTITLLGENRKFKLECFSISKYTIEQGSEINDLLTYEIGLERRWEDEEEEPVFRGIFFDGKIEIFCKEIRIKEILQ
jgi:hypothetical protein